MRIIVISLFSIAISLSNCMQRQSAAVLEQPNIVFILMDDLGWASITSYGNSHVNTVNIDRLAQEGMRFTDAYVTPQCTPTRAIIMTGQNSPSNKMWHVIPRYYYPYQRMREPTYIENLSRETFTIAEALQKKGYRTAIFGKWHLHNFGTEGYYTRLFKENAHYYGFDQVDPETDPTEYQSRTDKGVNFLTEQTIRFMEQNKSNPFFVYLSHHTIHGPVLAPDSLVKMYIEKGYPDKGVNNATYLAAIEHFDNSIGKILNKLDELDLSKKTIVIFTSDNGGVDTEFNNAPLRYGKGSPYEGGIRVPFIIRWPGVVAKGKLNETAIHAMDLYPTLVEIAGGDPSQYNFLDGLSLVPELNGTSKLKRESLYWYMPLYDHLTYSAWAATPAAVIRKGNYKLIKFFGDYIDISAGYKRHIPGKRLELYDLKNDLGEQVNLAGGEKDLTIALEKELDDWLASEGAELPLLNENYNADSLWVRSK